ncbi:MAG: signal peptide peptidase SppA, partial [Pseudomonadales bacterium]
MNDTAKPSRWATIGNALTRVRLVLSNLFFFGFLLLAILVLFSRAPLPEVPDGGALVIDPAGAIVERRTPIDPVQQFLSPQSVLAETEFDDLLEALRHARDDARIGLLVLDLDDLQSVSTAHAFALADALRQTREAGKRVVAYGSQFAQQPYLIASAAEAVYLHPLGQVLLPGYQINNLYFKGLLEKLDINVHVFRAGRYKEFVEPYTLAGMSDEAREANTELLQGLWSRYRHRVIDNRALEDDRFQRFTQSPDAALAETGGDLARLAVEYHLVDELLTPDQARARFADVAGRDEQGDYRRIGFREYLQAVQNAAQPEPSTRVGVITAEGPIVAGDPGRGLIGADRVVALIREARRDDTVGALVMRINTPGGSSFASELIRQELELTQVAGKPVVISMGPVAASGGYWISATADAIVAEPTTITGSIGVFGILPTFERSLAELGVTTDGVATTPLGGADLLTGLNEPTRAILQASTEHTYRHFLNLVARGRDMAPERVEQLAEGRVWVGDRALDLGLVDLLGDEQAAIARAAELAGLSDYGVKHIEPPLTTQEMLLRALTGNVHLTGIARAGGWLELPPLLAPLLHRAGDAWLLL